ncbi:MAG: GNAT family N-acetyltransferase [Terriglobia bacterium]
MPKGNLERMIKLAEQFFDTKHDPAQISVTPPVIERLKKIHPSTLTERKDRNGPFAWVLVIPTTRPLMERFVSKRITEQELLEETPLRGRYDALYLCSALVLPEYRGRGVARRLVSKAIKSIQKQHPIRYLFYWAFSREGERLATRIAEDFALPLRQRPG